MVSFSETRQPYEFDLSLITRARDWIGRMRERVFATAEQLKEEAQARVDYAKSIPSLLGEKISSAIDTTKSIVSFPLELLKNLTKFAGVLLLIFALFIFLRK